MAIKEEEDRSRLGPISNPPPLPPDAAPPTPVREEVLGGVSGGGRFPGAERPAFVVRVVRLVEEKRRAGIGDGRMGECGWVRGSGLGG